MLTLEKIQSAVFITIYVSIFSTLIAFFLSMIFGYLIAIYQFQLKKPIVIFLSSLTSIPPVCAGLLVYILISRSGPLGWMEILYSPLAMIIAQIVIIFPIMITLIIKVIIIGKIITIWAMIIAIGEYKISIQPKGPDLLMSI